MFLAKTGKICLTGLAVLFLFVAGCSKPQQQGQQAVTVKAMKVIQRDATLVNEYAGQIRGTNEVPVKARVAGHIEEKMITGGQMVKKGQPLFRIDNRPYLSASLNAQAALAQAEATLANTGLDTVRYRQLYEANAISEQKLTTQEALEKQQEAIVKAQRALVQKAQDDLNDTIVTSPIEGRLYVDDVSIGTYVQPGSSVLVTVGLMDPVHAQFNMSENEYLEMWNNYQEPIAKTGWGSNVAITLSDGSKYPYMGEVTEVDRGMGSNSGTLTINASFANPDYVLLPGMFARVKIEGTPLKNTLMIPQRSVQQVLEKSYVMVIGEDNKVKAKPVTLGRKFGSFWLVKDGLSAEDVVVVEGLTKIQEGAVVEAKIVTAEEMSLTFE